MIEIHNGDCLELMKNLPTSSVDLVETDKDNLELWQK